MKKFVASSILTVLLLGFTFGGTVGASEPPKPVINSIEVLLQEPPKPVINSDITLQQEPPKPVIN